MRRRIRLRNFNWKIITIICLIALCVIYMYQSFDAKSHLTGFIRAVASEFTVKYNNATEYDGGMVEEIVGEGTGTLSGMFSRKEVTVSGNDDKWYDESLKARGQYVENNQNGDEIVNDGNQLSTENNEENADTSESISGEDESNNSNENSSGADDKVADNDEPETDSIDNQESTVGEGAEADANVSKNIYVSMPEATGIKYTLEDLSSSNYIISKFYTVPSSTKLLSTDVNINNIMAYDATIKQDNNKPQILIYHTHSMEGYADSVSGDTSTGIVAVGEYLATILTEQFGYNVIHCTESFDVDDNGYVDRSNAYKKARTRLVEILEENPSIEVILDVHRDGVDESLKFVTEVNGKKTAKIMFFNGLCRDSKGNPYGSSEYREENLALSLQMKLLAEEYYPSFTRKNYVNAYHYNMNLREKSMLIEVGAQTNTLEEAKNAMEPLAVLLSKVLN